MNRIDAYLDEIFAGFADTQEMRDLKQEVRQNCEDRYRECLARGMAPEAAEAYVRDHIGDFSQLLKEMREEEGDAPADVRRSLTSRMEKNSAHAEESRTYDALIARMTVSVGARDVCVEASPDGVVEVECGDEMRQQVYGDELIIDENTRQHAGFAGFFLAVTETLETLTIRVPENFSELKITTTTGDVHFDGVSLQNVQVNTVSGDLAGELADIACLKLETSSGDADLSVAGVEAKVAMRTASGDMEMDLRGVKETTLTSASGDMELRVHDPFASMRISSVSGDVTLHAGALRGLDLEVDTVSGDVRNEVPSVERTNPVRISTVSGDVRVCGD